MSNDSVKLISHKSLNNYVTVLAICDDPPPSSSKLSHNSKKNNSTSSTIISVPCNEESGDESPVVLRSIKFKSTNESKNNIVEVVNLDTQPIHKVAANNVLNSNAIVPKKLNNLSFNKTTKKTLNNNNLFLSPDNDHVSKHVRSFSNEPSSSLSFLNKNNARKSRFTDAFLDAKERLDQNILQYVDKTKDNVSFAKFFSSKIVLNAETINVPIGVDISAVPNPETPNKILAVEIIRIEENGRIDRDNRLKIGDQITEINGQSCANMSLSRARLCLRDLQNILEPSISFNRQVFQKNSVSSEKPIPIKLIKSALQEANISTVGNKLILNIQKGKNGFGFSFAGRMNALNEHLFYVKTVVNDGPSWEILKIGDRLLKIDEIDLSNLKQFDVTAILKSKKIGETIQILASRISTDNIETNETVEDDCKNETNLKNNLNVTKNCDEEKDLKNNLPENELKEISNEIKKDNRELITLNIILNDSPSAGLGISLKAQKIYNNGLALDSGLYIRSVLHGSAAFKDGRLKVDDRLVAVENENLLKYDLNGEALKAFIKCLSKMPSTAASVRIIVARKINNELNNQLDTDIPDCNVQKNDIVLQENQNDDVNAESESEASIATNSGDPFVRDAVIRKSISEKRPLGVSNDLFNLETYKRIKHYRQTSAIASTSEKIFLPRSSLSLTRPSNRKKLLKNNKRRSLNCFVNYQTNNEVQNIEKSINEISCATQEKPLTPISKDFKEKVLKSPISFFELENNNDTMIELYNSKNLNNFKSINKFNNLVEFPENSTDSTLNLIYEKNKSFSTSPKFFDFFKTNVIKETKFSNNVKEINNKEKSLSKITSLERRSASIDQSLENEKKLNEKNLESTLSCKKIKESIDDQMLKEKKTSIPSSISQPLFGVKSAFKIYEKDPNLKKELTTLSPKEKRQRRKSTGSGFFKLFQKTNSNLHCIQDERDVVKYNYLLDEKSRIKAIDEDFRREYGLINQKNNINCNTSPKTNQCIPYTFYNQMFPNLSKNDFFRINQNNFSSKNLCNQLNKIRHQRNHSAQELSKFDRINKESSDSFIESKKHCFGEYNGRDTSFCTQNSSLYPNCKIPSSSAYIVSPLISSPHQCLHKEQYCFHKKNQQIQNNKNLPSYNCSTKQCLYDSTNYKTSKNYCSCFTNPTLGNVFSSTIKHYNDGLCRRTHLSNTDFYDYNSFNTWFVNSENVYHKKKEIENKKEKE